MRATLSKRGAGAALLLVLWAMLLLTGAVLGWARWVRQDLERGTQAQLGMEATAMAHSGVAMALHPNVSRISPQLQREIGAQLGYHVRMEGEGGRLNLNWLLAGEDPRKIQLLKRWMEEMGLDFQEREVLVDCLLDYVDADNLKRLNGVEEAPGYRAPNRPFLSLDEVAKVPGSEALLRAPGWREMLTLYSDGPVDLSSASPEVLRLLPGVGDDRVQRFVMFRNGRDGVLGTEDDMVLKSVEEVALQFFGMNAKQSGQLKALAMVKDPVVRITARGNSGKVIRQVEVVVRKGGGNPAILYWNE